MTTTTALPPLVTVQYVALYCRISVDRSGRKEGVGDQEKWGRAYAAQHWPGVPIVVFKDNDLSAMKDDVVRDGFEDLRAAIARGEVAHLWSVEQSRPVRGEIAWFLFAAELAAAGIDFLHTNRDGIVRVQDEVAGIKAVLNAAEVRKLRQRVTDTKRERAADGVPSGGSYYGYRPATLANGVKTLEVIPEQAANIRFAADKLLNGWSLSSIVAALRERGARGSMGGQVWITTVRSWFGPATSGLRMYHGEVVGPGNWPAILDNETRLAVVAKLSQPRQVRNKRGEDHAISSAFFGRSTSRKHLLTGGFTRCGVCGHKLAAQKLKMGNVRDTPVVPYLACHRSSGGRGCVGIPMVPTQQVVLDNLWEQLDAPGFLDALAADDHGARRDQIITSLGALEAKRTRLATRWSADELSDEEWSSARSGILARETDLRAELAALPAAALDLDAVAAARRGWEAMTLDEQREFLGLFIDHVRIGRGKKGPQKTFNSGRITIVWKEAASAALAV